MPIHRARAYCFTWNNPPADYRTHLEALECAYIVAGEELAPTTGTPHLQGYVYWRNAKTLSACRRKLPGCHVVAARGTHSQNRAYCTKTRPTDTEPNTVIYERGTLPSDPADRGQAEHDRWESAWDAAISGRLLDIPADIRVRQYSTLRRIERDHMAPVERLAGPCGTWIYGEAGTGKTRSVLDQFPDAFPKPRTKWWDGYQGEDIVLIDDLDKYDVRLGGNLKHWADAYPFIGESKGHSQKIRPKRVIVTSQYRIADIWDDAETRAALLRRFIVKEKILGENIEI